MGKKIVLAVNGAAGKVQLLTADANQAVRVKLAQGNKYLLKGVDDNFAPENVMLKRAGSELHVIQQGDARPSIIIEDYFNGSAAHPDLMGIGKDGQIYAYAPLTGGAAYETGYLVADGDTSAVFLGGTPLGSASDAPVTSASDASASSSGVSYTMFGILGGIGAIAGIAIAASDSGGNDSNISHNEGNGAAGTNNGSSSEVESSAPLAQPAIDEVLDNSGAQTGALASGDVTDETRPAFSGQSEAGNILTVYDNGTALGSVVADQDGNWAFTPENALSEGEHAFTVIAQDASGNASAPSDPITITIDTTTAQQSDDAGADGALSELLDSGDDTLDAFFPNEEEEAPDYTAGENSSVPEYDVQAAQYALAPAATLADMHTGLADLLQSAPAIM